MAKFTSEQKTRLLEDTREAAAAFLDDIKYLREVVSRDNTLGDEVRRISGILRRLLIERDIAKIAGPRLGKIMYRSPDNEPIYRMAKKIPLLFFLSGRVNVLGWNGIISALDLPGNSPNINPLPPDFDIARTVDLRLDNFVAQHVLCHRNRWISRGAVIKYMANIASGVHSGAPKTAEEILLSWIRNNNYLTLRSDGGVHLDISAGGEDHDYNSRFIYKPNAIDPLLVEVLSAAHFLTTSPDVTELERIIIAEF